MADLPNIKKEVQGSAGPMPPPPIPGADSDLPAPSPPAEPGKTPQETGLPPAPSAAFPPGAPPARAPKPEMPGGIDAVKPLKFSQNVSKPAEAAAEEVADIHGSPPVFIKIDKYSEIVKNLGRLKSYALSLRDALDALTDIEKELTTGIAISNKALDDFNSTIAMLDSKLLRAGSIREIESSDVAEMDGYIKGIYDQMEKIKGELDSIK